MEQEQEPFVIAGRTLISRFNYIDLEPQTLLPGWYYFDAEEGKIKPWPLDPPHLPTGSIGLRGLDAI